MTTQTLATGKQPVILTTVRKSGIWLTMIFFLCLGIAAGATWERSKYVEWQFNDIETIVMPRNVTPAQMERLLDPEHLAEKYRLLEAQQLAQVAHREGRQEEAKELDMIAERIAARIQRDK